MRKKRTIAATLCLLVAGACLLGVLYYPQGMSLRNVPAVSTTATNTPSQDLAVISSATSSEASSTSTEVGSTSEKRQVSTPGRYIKVVNGITYEVVTTPAAQEQGLSGRSSVPNNYAMLFDFPKDGTYGFWMKDMLVPLDMVWVTSSGSIAAINSDVLPSTYPGVLYPPIPIRYVLETRAGFAQEEGWHVGTVLTLPVS